MRLESDRFRFSRKLGGHLCCVPGVPFDVTQDIFNASNCVMTMSVVWFAKAHNLFQFVQGLLGFIQLFWRSGARL